MLGHEVCMMETETKRVLDALGTPILQYPFYLCFARDLWQLHQQNNALDFVIGRLIVRWHKRGLNLDTLNAIRVQVFAIPDAQQTGQ